MNRVDRHDICVLQSREPLRLASRAKRHLERDRAAGQRFLTRQENAGKGPLSQFFDELEAQEAIANAQANTALLWQLFRKHRAR